MECLITSLVNVKARREWNAIDGRANLPAFEPKRSGWQPLGIILPQALKLDRADNRAIAENTASAV